MATTENMLRKLVTLFMGKYNFLCKMSGRIDNLLQIRRTFSLFRLNFSTFCFHSDPRHIPVFVTLLINHKHERLRLKILKLMADIMTSQSVPEGNRCYWHLKPIGLSALTEQLSGGSSQDCVSQALVKSLLRLGVSEHDENKGVYVLMHYHVVLAVLEMIENGNLDTKLFVSHMVRVFRFKNRTNIASCNTTSGAPVCPYTSHLIDGARSKTDHSAHTIKCFATGWWL